MDINCAGRAEEMHVRGAAQHQAKRICHGCPALMQCLGEGLDGRHTGVWGGTTDRDRVLILKRRPNVKSWALLLEAAHQDYLRRTSRPSPAADGP